MGKKTEQSEADQSTTEVEEVSYEDKIKNCSVIAKPMASKKLTKKCYKLIKKAIKHKTYVRNGLREVQMRIRKGERGIVFFAGDVTPVDIVCHLPAVCEDKDIPYCYVPSRADLGASLGVKRACLMVMVREHEEYKESFDECKTELKNLSVDL